MSPESLYRLYSSTAARMSRRAERSSISLIRRAVNLTEGSATLARITITAATMTSSARV